MWSVAFDCIGMYSNLCRLCRCFVICPNLVLARCFQIVYLYLHLTPARVTVGILVFIITKCFVSSTYFCTYTLLMKLSFLLKLFLIAVMLDDCLVFTPNQRYFNHITVVTIVDKLQALKFSLAALTSIFFFKRQRNGLFRAKWGWWYSL